MLFGQCPIERGIKDNGASLITYRLQIFPTAVLFASEVLGQARAPLWVGIKIINDNNNNKEIIQINQSDGGSTEMHSKAIVSTWDWMDCILLSHRKVDDPRKQIFVAKITKRHQRRR